MKTARLLTSERIEGALRHCGHEVSPGNLDPVIFQGCAILILLGGQHLNSVQDYLTNYLNNHVTNYPMCEYVLSQY